MKKIVVYYNAKTNSHYYRYVYDFFDKFSPGYKNQYGHVVVLTIDLFNLIHKVPLRKKLIRKLISLLKKFS